MSSSVVPLPRPLCLSWMLSRHSVASHHDEGLMVKVRLPYTPTRCSALLLRSCARLGVSSEVSAGLVPMGVGADYQLGALDGPPHACSEEDLSLQERCLCVAITASSHCCGAWCPWEGVTGLPRL